MEFTYISKDCYVSTTYYQGLPVYLLSKILSIWKIRKLRLSTDFYEDCGPPFSTPEKATEWLNKNK